VGYCFINFLEPRFIVPFVQEFNGQRWRSFNSEKVCVVSFARIQGKAAMVSRFQNSSLLEKDDEYRPLLFYSSGPEKGYPEPFPAQGGRHGNHSGGHRMGMQAMNNNYLAQQQMHMMQVQQMQLSGVGVGVGVNMGMPTSSPVPVPRAGMPSLNPAYTGSVGTGSSNAGGAVGYDASAAPTQAYDASASSTSTPQTPQTPQTPTGGAPLPQQPPLAQQEGNPSAQGASIAPSTAAPTHTSSVDVSDMPALNSPANPNPAPANNANPSTGTGSPGPVSVSVSVSVPVPVSQSQSSSPTPSGQISPSL
jgi:hypothetical protein